MLPDRVVEQIKAKETAQIAAREERRQRKSAAEQLADAVRREELRQLGNQRTPAEQREFSRLEARRRRAGKSKDDSLSDVASAEKFWEANRLLLPKKKLDEYLAQQERVFDILFWTNYGWLEPQAADFVSLEEGLAGIDVHITEHGLIHDDVTAYQHHVLRDFVPGWGVWAPHDIENDPIWGYVPAYFKDAARFKALCEESEPTMVYAKFGVRIALPAYHVRLFKQRITEHKSARMLGTWEQHVNHESEKCWLCQYEQQNGEQI